LYGEVRIVNGFCRRLAIRNLGWSILRRMTQEKTERANCHFVIKQNPDGKPQIIVERYHQTISVLNNTVLGERECLERVRHCKEKWGPPWLRTATPQCY
jgi:hypothetical protein